MFASSSSITGLICVTFIICWSVHIVFILWVHCCHHQRYVACLPLATCSWARLSSTLVNLNRLPGFSSPQPSSQRCCCHSTRTVTFFCGFVPSTTASPKSFIQSAYHLWSLHLSKVLSDQPTSLFRHCISHQSTCCHLILSDQSTIFSHHDEANARWIHLLSVILLIKILSPLVFLCIIINKNYGLWILERQTTWLATLVFYIDSNLTGHSSVQIANGSFLKV